MKLKLASEGTRTARADAAAVVIAQSETLDGWRLAEARDWGAARVLFLRPG